MFGVFYMLCLKSIPYICIILMLENWYFFLYDCFPTAQFAGMDLAYFLFWVSIPYLMRHGASLFYCILVILQKKLIIGKFKEGQTDGKGWLRYWIHERSTRGHDWGEVVEPLINTELLTMIYRALGAKMGYRVQMDAVKVTEHDLLTVEDYAVFGSSVTVTCTDEHGVRFPVSVGKAPTSWTTRPSSRASWSATSRCSAPRPSLARTGISHRIRFPWGRGTGMRSRCGPVRRMLLHRKTARILTGQ